MLNQEKNSASANNSNTCQEYHYNHEAVNEFFGSYISPKELARQIRHLSHETLLMYQRDNNGINLAQYITNLNEFAEAIDPYFFTTNE